MTGTLPTGIEVLDRKLDGGIPAGTTVALSAPPVSQSELFLYEVAAPRPTTYLTTERTVTDVSESLARTSTDPDGVDLHRIGPANPLSDARDALPTLPDRGTLVVDPMRLLEETEPDAYRSFLNEIKSRTAETEGLAVLHCLDGRRVPDQRDRTEYLADAVFALSTEIEGGTLQNSLAVPKFRGGHALPESIALDLTEDVTIDVTRKIA